MFGWISTLIAWASRKKKPAQSWPFLRFEGGLSINLPVTDDGKCGHCGYPIRRDADGEPYCFACQKGLEEIGYGGGPDPTSY